MQNPNESLSEIIWAIEASDKEFSLLLATCNYEAFRTRMIASLREQSSLRIREVTLQPSATNICSTISIALGNDTPDALMILGFDKLANIDNVLLSANQAREEFRRKFSFPLIFWVNDNVLDRLIHIAPDLKSWGGVAIRFELSDEDLLDALEQNGTRLLNEILMKPTGEQALCNLSNPNEFESFLADLKTRNISLSPELQADLNLLHGRCAQNNKEFDNAIKFYEDTLSFWKEKPERAGVRTEEIQGALLCLIARCYGQKNDFENAISYFRKCITAFEAHQDLAARYLCELCHILKISGDWKTLGTTAKEALELNHTCGDNLECAKCYSFLAETALHHNDWESAIELAQHALNMTAPDVRDNARLILAKAYQGLQQPKKAIQSLEDARKEGKPESDPDLYRDILNLLYDIYIEQKEYVAAFKIKQKKYSLEHQLGFRAFIGAGRIEYTEGSDVAQEIQASGRYKDIEDLINKLSEQRSKLIVFHGESGVGKSSVLEAGLVPALKKTTIRANRVEPVLIRSYTKWITSCYEALPRNKVSDGSAVRQDEAEPLISRYKAEPCNEKFILEHLRKNDQENIYTILIFDQFEEFFFANPEPEKRQEFYTFVHDALDISNVKMVFSLREDYLHYLLECERIVKLDIINRDILTRNIRYFLGNFTPKGAKELIRSLTRPTGFQKPHRSLWLEDALIDRIVDDLAKGANGVRPIELQIVGSQIEANAISTLDAYKPKHKLIEGFLEEVVRDCGKENEDMTRLVLYSLTDEKLTRPLKTRAEILAELKNSNIAVPEEQLDTVFDTVLEILKSSGLIFLVPGKPERFQLVHDYLVALIREKAKILIKTIEEEKIRQEFEKKLAEQEEKRKQEEAERKRKREQEGAEKERKRQRKQLKIAVAAGVAFAMLAAAAILFGFQAKQAEQEATDNMLQAKQAEQEATDNMLQANYNLARAFEEKAGLLIKNAKTTQDYQKAWLFTLDALRQNIGDRNLPVSLGRQGNIRLRHNIFPCIWESPDLASHSSSVNSVVFSPDGTRIASGSSDNTVRLWDTKTGKKLITFSGHSSSVNSVVFSPDGTRIASGSDDNTVRLWDAKTGKKLTTFSGHLSSVLSVAFSSDGTRIASGSSDNTVRLWDAATGKEITKFIRHSDDVNSVAFSSDGTRIVSGSSDNTVRLWDTKTGKELTTFSGHSSFVNSVAFCSDGTLVVSGSSDNTVRLWDIKTWKELTIFSGHSDSVRSVAFSPDGTRVVSGSDDKTVRLWDTKTGKELTIFFGHLSPVLSVAFAPNGKHIISGSYDNTVILWDTRTGKKLATFSDHSSSVKSVAFSPDGTCIASGSSDNTLKLWDLQTGKKLITLFGHSDSVNSIAFSSDGTRIASGSSDKTVRVWNTKTGKKLVTFLGRSGSVNSVAFSPDGSYIVFGSDDNKVKLLNARTGKELTTFSGHLFSVRSVAFSSDGTHIISGSYDNTLRLWDIRTGKKFIMFSGHSYSVLSIAFSPDGTRIASGSDDKTVRLWNAKTGKELIMFSGHSDSVRSVEFSPDGTRIASGSDDKTVRLWDIKTEKELITLSGHLFSVRSVAFSPDGMHIISGSDDKILKLWDINTKRELAIFSGHSGSINSVTFSPDGTHIASGADDKTVRLWDAWTGRELATFSGYSSSILSVSFSHDGTQIVSGYNDNTLRLLDTLTGKELATFSGHSFSALSVSFSPDGTLIASGSDDNTVQVWETNTGKELIRFTGHSGSINSVAFSPDVTRIISGSDDKTIRIWKLDLLNAYLKEGKDSPLFKKICEVSFTIFPFHLEGINMVPGARRFLPLRGQPNPWKVIERPRPPHKDIVEWMIENMDRMDETD